MPRPRGAATAAAGPPGKHRRVRAGMADPRQDRTLSAKASPARRHLPEACDSCQMKIATRSAQPFSMIHSSCPRKCGPTGLGHPIISPRVRRLRRRAGCGKPAGDGPGVPHRHNLRQEAHCHRRNPVRHPYRQTRPAAPAPKPPGNRGRKPHSGNAGMRRDSSAECVAQWEGVCCQWSNPHASRWARTGLPRRLLACGLIPEREFRSP